MAGANPVGRADIESKLREIKAEVHDTAQQAAPLGIAIGVTAVLTVVAAAYLIGRRRGRKRSTVVEIRRI